MEQYIKTTVLKGGDGSPEYSILVVEDNRETLTLIARMLRKQFDVTPISDAVKVIPTLIEKPYDIILMDINLGTDKSGIDLLFELRELKGYKQVPVVALTAYALPGDRERFLDLGFDSYVGKPFTRQQLMFQLNRILITLGPPRS